MFTNQWFMLKMSQNQNQNEKLHIPMKKTKDKEYLSILKNAKRLKSPVKKLHRAIVTNNTETVQQLLTMGVDPNEADNILRSPLHLAASRGYKEIVSLLIKFGANPNARDIIGNTPLHLAACMNNIEIVTLLLNAGTDINSLDNHGRNPLNLAESKLKLLQNRRRDGEMEIAQLRAQVQQVFDLMLSFLTKQNVNENLTLQCMNLNINDSTDDQIDDKVSLLLNAIQEMSLK